MYVLCSQEVNVLRTAHYVHCELRKAVKQCTGILIVYTAYISLYGCIHIFSNALYKMGTYCGKYSGCFNKEGSASDQVFAFLHYLYIVISKSIHIKVYNVQNVLDLHIIS